MSWHKRELAERGTTVEHELNDAVAALALEDGAIFYGKPFGSLEALESGRRDSTSSSAMP